MEFEYSYYSSESDDSSIQNDSLESVDYAGQTINSSGSILRAITVGMMLFTFSICEPASANKPKASLVFSEPDISVVEQINNSFTEDQKEWRDQLLQQWRTETMNLGLLRDDWDGEGALRVSTTAIRNVLKLLNDDKVRLDLIQDIYPNEKGTVTIEWDNYNGDCAGIQIGRQRMSYYLSLHDNDIFKDYEPVNSEGVKKLFHYLSLL